MFSLKILKFVHKLNFGLNTFGEISRSDVLLCRQNAHIADDIVDVILLRRFLSFNVVVF